MIPTVIRKVTNEELTRKWAILWVVGDDSCQVRACVCVAMVGGYGAMCAQLAVQQRMLPLKLLPRIY